MSNIENERLPPELVNAESAEGKESPYVLWLSVSSGASSPMSTTPQRRSPRPSGIGDLSATTPGKNRMALNMTMSPASGSPSLPSQPRRRAARRHHSSFKHRLASEKEKWTFCVRMICTEPWYTEGMALHELHMRPRRTGASEAHNTVPFLIEELHGQDTLLSLTGDEGRCVELERIRVWVENGRSDPDPNFREVNLGLYMFALSSRVQCVFRYDDCATTWEMKCRRTYLA
ncbi:hypothetical protein B0H14DRAFT_2603071 [Mycena olivaceomarginata]|nr:hypothetical protein B0H14DRAFT_2603071 [Mycena olivaceomarginata]